MDKQNNTEKLIMTLYVKGRDDAASNPDNVVIKVTGISTTKALVEILET